MRTYAISVLGVIGVIILIGAVGCAEQVTGPGPAAGGSYLGAEVCRLCHSTAYNDEMMTEHFTTMVDDPDDPYDFISVWEEDGKPEYCLPCHTTGWDETVDNGGADEPGRLKLLSGIQCEVCHGPGSEHVDGGGDATKINLSYGSDVCGACHTGEHQPTYDEWETSKHAEALADLVDLPFAQTSCLICHSADYYYDRTVTIDTAEYAIECTRCHRAHGSNEEHQLILPSEELCASCHNAEGAQVGDTPHHPTLEMFMGYGAYEWPGEPYSNSPHTTLITERCVKCHMYTQDYEEPNPAITGHTFEPNINVCQECHTGATDFDIDGAQTEIEGLIAQLQAELDAGEETDPNYAEALFDLEFCENEGSFGVHNHNYAKDLLEDSINYYEPTGKRRL